MIPELSFSPSGLSEFTISFEEWCIPCPIQSRCRFGKKNPLTVVVDCKDLIEAYEKERYRQMQKAQKEADINDTYEDIEKRVKVNISQIFSGVWKKVIKSRRNEILCLNPKRIDPMISSQRGGEWWIAFSAVMRRIYAECRKIGG